MFLHDLPGELVNTFFNIAYSLIASDGVITETEKETLSLYAIELHLQEMPECNFVELEDVLDKFKGLNKRIKKEIYFELLSLAYVDSVYDEKEKELLRQIAVAFDIKENEHIEFEGIVCRLLREYNKLGVILNE